MKANRRILTILIAMTLLVSAALCQGAGALASGLTDVTMETSDVDKQLVYLYSQIENLRQKDSANTWYYTVVDLDHDGSLEFVAASQHPQDRSTNLKVWEVGGDRNSLQECALLKEEDESFPDILTDCADVYHDTATNAWYYMLYDNVVLSESEIYTIKTAVSLQNGVIGYQAYAVEHTSVVNGARGVSHTDASGVSISPEQYNAAGTNAFAAAERSSVGFEWLTDRELGSLVRLIESYAVFTGVKAPTENFPVPRPAALSQPVATPAPTAVPTAAPTPAPAAPVYLSVTKNPTNETRNEGATAYFVSCANAYESLTWTLVAPNGGEYSVQSFRNVFTRASVSGEYSTTLSISNVSADMNNWGAYCTFYYKGQTARTSTAYIYVVKQEQKTAPSGTYSGYVTEWNYSSVTLRVENSVTVTIPWGLCDVVGDLYYGAPASVSWNGTDVTYCYIAGSTPNPQPIYGSMSGVAYEGGGGFAIYLSNGSQVFVDSWLCDVSGSFYDGASCVVYYTDSPSSANIYSVDIYGDYGMGGWAGSNYYENEYVYNREWGNYIEPHYDGEYGYETNNYVEVLGDYVPTHVSYNADGSTYEAVWCPACGAEVSLAMEYCPVCGMDLY